MTSAERPGMVPRAEWERSQIELLGRVGDAIADAQKHMDKVDAEVDREPGDPFKEKAREYAARAETLAASLRAICDEWEPA